MKTQNFKPILLYRISRIIFYIVWILVESMLLFILFVMIPGMLPALSDFPLHMTLLISTVIFFMIYSSVIFLAISTAGPSITVSDQGFRVETLLGKSQWFKWDAIRKVKKPLIPTEGYWMVGVERLPWYYYLNGFIQRVGMGGFGIGKSYENYGLLIQIMKEKRPDLFKEGTV